VLRGQIPTLDFVHGWEKTIIRAVGADVLAALRATDDEEVTP
jgi:hypothetical protein